MLRRLSTLAVFLGVLAIPGTGARAAKRFPISMPGSSDGPRCSCEIEAEGKRPCPGSVGVVMTPGGRGHLRVGGGVLVAGDLFLTDSHVFLPEHRGTLDEKVNRPKIKIRFPKAVSPSGEALP